MNDDQPTLRHVAYAVLIVASAGNMLGHILSVSDNAWGTPFLSANDRSRWCTVRSLVEEGTFAIDKVTAEPGWHTIDKVWHAGPDGKFHFYSSKPPLFSIVVAGEYWVLYNLTGATLYDHPYYVGRALLIVTNLVPVVLMLALLAFLIERYGTTDFGRILAMAGAAFGTFITTFSVTLNNHVPAAVCLTILLAVMLPIWYDECRNPLRFILAGLFAGLLVACELPALALTAVVTVALLWRVPWLTLAAYMPGLLLVMAAVLGTNYLAHGVWKPAYSQRGDGPELARLDAPAGADSSRSDQSLTLDGHQFIPAIAKQLDVHVGPSAQILVHTPGERWELRDLENGRRWAIVKEGDALSIRRWDNWYDYDGSYWRGSNPVGVDRGEPDIAVYAFHVLVGHHGIFSLTPLWILSAIGAWMLLFDRERNLRDVAILAIGVTVVCLAFYFAWLPARDRNYGGITCGFRWVFWLAPLWILLLLPAADWLSRERWRQGLGLLLLLASCFSAGYTSLNPWRHPWPYEFGSYMGWFDASGR